MVCPRVFSLFASLASLRETFSSVCIDRCVSKCPIIDEHHPRGNRGARRGIRAMTPESRLMGRRSRSEGVVNLSLTPKVILNYGQRRRTRKRGRYSSMILLSDWGKVDIAPREKPMDPNSYENRCQLSQRPPGPLLTHDLILHILHPTD